MVATSYSCSVFAAASWLPCLALRPRAVAADMGMAGTQSTGEVAQEKVGVLLLNLGGPETLADVRPFLYNLFADPDIIRLPAAVAWLQRPIALLISSLRAPKVGPLPAPYASPAQGVASEVKPRGGFTHPCLG